MIKLGIDVGHGGEDPGAMGNGLREKDLTLAIALEIRGLLMAYEGIEVLLTRTTDKTLSLPERTDMLNKWGANLIVSLHINAGGGNGFESFTWNGQTDNQTVAAQNVIHSEVMKLIGGKDRGKKRADFHMLRESAMPAMLTENLFIDNPGDAQKLKDKSFIKKIAQGHANGVIALFGLKKKKIEPKEPEVGLENGPEGIPILGESKATREQLLGYAKSINPDFPGELAELYLGISKGYGIKGDVAFCQMLKETDFCRFGKDVKREQNNFCGLGAIGNGNPGHSFETMELGVVAHIQHLYAYATTKEVSRIVDPRFKYVERGSATTWEGLNGKWAVPGTNYGQDILAIHKKVVGFKVKEKDYKGHWAEKEIDKVVAAGLMIGDDKGNFAPDKPVSRAELATVLSRLIDKGVVKNG
jgi:N-acetylmuramoyl-L-alanine amidase